LDKTCLLREEIKKIVQAFPLREGTDLPFGFHAGKTEPRSLGEQDMNIFISN